MSEEIEMDGLNQQEIRIINTPLKDLDQNLKSVACAISDKRVNFVHAENQRIRDAHAADRAEQLLQDMKSLTIGEAA